MDLYINSVGVISGAGNNMSGDFLLTKPDYSTHVLPCVEPEYKDYIPVMQLRRMSKIVRRGVVAAKTAMQHAGIEKPDALSIGTAYGCLQDTESFLGKMIDQDEQMLTPTAFIQSTHNTVGGQIALLAGCNGHNLTYVHRGHSFEHAMINAALYLDEHAGENILVGGIDELTENSIKALQVAGLITKDHLTTDDVINGSNEATVGGEGAAFFSVTQQPLSSKYIRVKALDIFKTKDEATALEKVKRFADNHKDIEIDLFLSGRNGDKKYLQFYNSVRTEVYPLVADAQFKFCCGEYPVAGSFALAMLFECLEQKGNLPEFMELAHPTGEIKNVVLVNNFGSYYSCWLLELPI